MITHVDPFIILHIAYIDFCVLIVLSVHMNSVTYLRLDGSVKSEKHFDIVKSFNSDPTIDVLLLTTHGKLCL